MIRIDVPLSHDIKPALIAAIRATFPKATANMTDSDALGYATRSALYPILRAHTLRSADPDAVRRADEAAADAAAASAHAREARRNAETQALAALDKAYNDPA